MEVKEMHRTILFLSTAIVVIFYTIMTWLFVELLGKTVGLPISVFVIGLLFIRDWRGIPEDPPHRGLRTFFGLRLPFGTLNEGFHYFPGYPFVNGLILENVSQDNWDLPEYTVRLPNNAQVSYEFSMTIRPSNLLSFLNAGGREEVKKHLRDMLATRLSIWGRSPDYGPQDHEEGINASDEILLMLMKAVLGDKLPQLPTSVPTSIVLKFFSAPRPELTRSEKRLYKNWKEVEDALKKDCPAPEEWQKLVDLAKQRKTDLEKIKRGEGDWEKENLGVTIVRLNHKKPPKYVGKIAETAEKKIVEKMEKEAEKVELQFGVKKINEIADKLGISKAEARELFQTERGKVKKEIKETKINLSEETRQILEKVLSGIADKLLAKKEP